jgi:uncharacterized protein YbgA (DUF1722 family)
LEFIQFVTKYPEHKEEAEERAAIMEIDGGFSRMEAEARSLLRLVEKYRPGRQGELWKL